MFCASVGPSEKVLCGRWTFCQLQSTFRVAVELSDNFQCARRNICQLFVHQRASVNFPCIRGTFCQLLSTFRAYTSPSVYFLCGCGTFHKLPSTFCVSAGPSVNFPCIRRTFCDLSMCLRDLLWTFHASVGPSVNIHPLSVHVQDPSSVSSALRGVFVK